MTSRPVLRAVTVEDSQQLFDWVNQADSLAGKARTVGPISRAEHEDWLARRLKDSDTFMHIIEMDGHPIGQVRLQRDSGQQYYVDIYVDGAWRGQGVAAFAVGQAVRQLAEQRPDGVAVALVRIENEPSIALFQRLGFTEKARSGALLTFEWRAPA